MDYLGDLGFWICSVSGGKGGLRGGEVCTWVFHLGNRGVGALDIGVWMFGRNEG